MSGQNLVDDSFDDKDMHIKVFARMCRLEAVEVVTCLVERCLQACRPLGALNMRRGIGGIRHDRDPPSFRGLTACEVTLARHPAAFSYASLAG